MEKDEAKVSHWFDLEPDQCIQWLLLEDGEERRVYVVTGQPPEGYEVYHGRCLSEKPRRLAGALCFLTSLTARMPP